MELYYHYCIPGFSNCYIAGDSFPPAGKGKTDNAYSVSAVQEPAVQETNEEGAPMYALIIDPGKMDAEILQFIEGNNFILSAVLITHDHLNHVRGLQTLKKIYDTEIYAVNPVVCGLRTNLVYDGNVLSIGPFSIEVISVPGHSADSAVFRIGNILFTGDALTAGLTGSTASSYGEMIEITALRNKILALPGDYTIFPGHGPPSSLEAERRFNTGIKLFEQKKNRRPYFDPL
jgi:glyoxylase-like metal-dependent hydrolase (beta-lactamase superfamily II)